MAKKTIKNPKIKKVEKVKTSDEEETRAEELDRKFAQVRKDKAELKQLMRNDPYINEFEEEEEEEMLHSARLREAGISNDYYENGDEYDEGDSSHDAHYNY